MSLPNFCLQFFVKIFYFILRNFPHTFVPGKCVVKRAARYGRLRWWQGWSWQAHRPKTAI